MARGRVYRRKKSDGSLSRFHAVIDLPRESRGKRRQITRTFDNRAQAHAWLAEVASADSKLGQTGPELGEYLLDWLDGQVYLRPSSRASYRMHLERHIIPALGNSALKELDGPQIQRFIHTLSQRGLAPNSVARILATLRSALGHAVRTGVLATNPAAGIRPPEVRRQAIHTWTPDEAAVFIDALPDDGLGIMLRLAAITGMRRGEVLALRWSAINLRAGLIRVEAARVAIGAEVVEGAPKSSSGYRSVFIDQATVQHLRTWRTAQKTDASHGYVCTDGDGLPLVPWHVSSAFRQLCEQLTLPPLRLHDLRHTSATLGLAAGESLKEVSTRLGHADITVTAAFYADVQPATARAPVERRAAFMRSAATQEASGDAA